MKTLAMHMIPLLLLGSIIIGCNDQDSPVSSENQSVHAPSGAQQVVFSYPYDLSTDPPYQNCATGADMQNYGTVEVYIRETTTPSNNTVIHGWVDYNAYSGVTLKNMTTNEVWTLHTGVNPFGEVIKENGFYILHYGWNELYKNASKQTLHINLKGYMKFDKDGNFVRYRESYTCQ